MYFHFRFLRNDSPILIIFFWPHIKIRQLERENALNNIDVVVLMSEDDKNRVRNKPTSSNTDDDWVLVTKDNVSKTNDRLNEYEIETKNEITKQKYFFNTRRVLTNKYNIYVTTILYFQILHFATQSYEKHLPENE